MPARGDRITLGQHDGRRSRAVVDVIYPGHYELRYFTATLYSGGRIFLLADWRGRAWLPGVIPPSPEDAR